MKTSQDLSVWQDHVAKAAKFPGPNSQYCREAGISKSQFVYWKGKLNPSGIKSRQTGVKNKVSNFVPVEILSSPPVKKTSLPEAKWLAEFLIHFMGVVR